MPFQTPTDLKAKDKSLIVCAGTVTCQTVGAMGSGFLAFKKLFNKNIHHREQEGGWQAALQEMLNAYHQQQKALPAYVRIAKQGNYIGGIATVPDYSGRKGLTSVKFANAEVDKNFKEQYEAAIKQAVLDAKELKRPLFLQPLGIGVYGWDPKIAAGLFAKVIVETDPNDEVDITIPIFDPSLTSNDEQFRKSFHAEMAKRGRFPLPEKKDVVKEDPKPVEKLLDNRDKLIEIVETLISNIENKAGGRWTSGFKSAKVNLLVELKKAITDEKEAIVTGSSVQADYLQKIMDVCQKKRNPLHFWAAPESVNEYKQLLKDEKIELPPEHHNQGTNEKVIK